jgi:nucleotide-binding universal stress UspA family protein
VEEGCPGSERSATQCRNRDNPGVDGDAHAVPAHPATAILTVAEAVGADLIVVGNRGMKGARRVLGSIPNHVSHHAHCDVLVVDTAGALV